MPARKRGYAEIEPEDAFASHEPGMLTKLRNDWRMANLMQWLYLFGKEFKIDEDFDMEDLEEECLKPVPSEKLAEVGLGLLKHVSSHRGLTLEIFDEYTRRQYLVRRPHDNPFGEGEQPKRFMHFDVFTKLKVLHQLTLWTMSNPERFRERMPETRDNEQTQWRIEELGWDSEDRAYFVLDDNRLYRRTYRPLPPPTPPKSKSKSKARPQPKPRPKGTRSSKRRRVETSEEPEDLDDEEGAQDADGFDPENGLGGDKWECLCVTLEEYQNFVQNVKRSKDLNEKALVKRLLQGVIPAIEKVEEDRTRKIAKRQKELMTLEKLATAKRSSRIASRVEKEKEDILHRENEERRQKNLAAAKRDVQRQQEMDDARTSRMLTREQRLKEREHKRVLQEEELRRMTEEQERIEKGEIESKKSERHLMAEMKKAKDALDELNGDEEEWVFDCSGCGVYGQNIDDGKHSIACERCNVWQHSACLKLSQEEAEKDDFHFVCHDCVRKEEETRRREEDAKKPKLPPLKFKLGGPTSPIEQKQHQQLELPVPQTTGEGMNVVMVDPAKPEKSRNADENTSSGKGVRADPLEQEQRQHASHDDSAHKDQLNGAADLGLEKSKSRTTDSSDIEFKTNGFRPDVNGTPSRLPNGHLDAHRQVLPDGRPMMTPDPSFEKARALTKSGSSAPGQISTIPLQGQMTPSLDMSGPNIPRMLPPQSSPTSSFIAKTPSASFTENAALPSTPAHPLVPQKQPSAAPSPVPQTTLQALSPAMEPPLRLDSDPRTSGISPVKNSSPPQPMVREANLQNGTSAPRYNIVGLHKQVPDSVGP